MRNGFARMRLALLLTLLLSACSRGAEADLATIREARSLTAEWALVNDQAAQRRLTRAYTDAMRKSLREQLRVAASSLTHPDSTYGREIRALLAQPDNADAQELKARAAGLKQIEDGLESA